MSRAEPVSGRLPNRTRRSESIPRRLFEEGKIHLLPLYALLMTSDLAREGIRNSGSFRFADHVYRNAASGRNWLGHALDRLLLDLKGARSMRSRFFHSQRETLRCLRETAAARRAAPMRGESSKAIVVVSVPCGIARDLLAVADVLRETDPSLYNQVRFVGIDLDPEALEISKQLTGGAHAAFEFRCSDALNPGTIPAGAAVIVSLGFGEFLTDDPLREFYRLCRASLSPGGRFLTSAMMRHRISDYLAREIAELVPIYRSREQLAVLLESAGFAKTEITSDDVGLQSLAIAENQR